MPVNAMGPTMAGGTQEIVHDGYELLYLPDVNNFELQRSGQSPVFYYIPNQIRLARKNGPDAGDYLFNMIRFAGAEVVTDAEGNQRDEETTGGLLTLSVTGAPPDRVLEESQQAIRARFQAQGDYFWGIRQQREPIFRPAIITKNHTTMSNVAPNARGLSPHFAATMARSSSGYLLPNGTTDLVYAARLPSRSNGVQAVATRDAEEAAGGNLDQWYWQLQGAGSGSIDPTGTHAFSALMGAYPSAIIWAAFKGAASPVIVTQAMLLKMWAPPVSIHIRGDWKRTFEHFSAHAKGRYLWASADIKAELNNMRTSGAIEVDIKVDPTIPGGEEMSKQIDKRTDLVFEKFMEQAKQIIFEPPDPTVEAAETDGGGGIFGFGVGLALKYRKDKRELNLDYRETRQIAYLQEHCVSSSLSGPLADMGRDPEAEKKYFMTVYLDEWPRKLSRIAKPVVAWGDKTVEFVSVQFGYPDHQGSLMWKGHSFSASGGADQSFRYAIMQRDRDEVSGPPEDWEPGKTFVKRKVHLSEPPSEIENPFVRVQVDKNLIELDPEPNGTPTNDVNIEVRADTAGRLAVGPIDIGVALQDETQIVEVVMEPTDDQGEPIGRPQVRFRWSYTDAAEDRLWMLFTGDPTFRPFYRYKVRCIVKGTFFSDGMEWEGPWIASGGNGPVTCSIPKPSDRGVRARDLTPEAVAREFAPAMRGVVAMPRIAPVDDGHLPAPARAAAPQPAPVVASPVSDVGIIS